MLSPQEKKTQQYLTLPNDCCTKQHSIASSWKPSSFGWLLLCLKDLTSLDKVKLSYGSNVNKLFINPVAIVLSSNVKEGQNNLGQGWALKSKRRGTFSDKQRNYMYIYAVKTTWRKINLYRASMKIKKFETWRSVKIFVFKEWILDRTTQQISSYSSRLVLKTWI